MTLLRFALPPSLPGAASVDTLIGHSRLLRESLSRLAGVDVDVVVARDYDAIRQALVTGAVDAALAPPVVCAQVSSPGAPALARVPVPLQTVRRGHALFASAIVGRRDRRLTFTPRTLRAAWVDPLSVCGHLLPKAWLRQQRHRLEGFFVDERFWGAYRLALQAVVDGDADICGVHVLPGGRALDESIEAHLPGASGLLAAIAVTDAVPGDGVAVLPRAAVLVEALQRLPKDVVQTVFRADGFIPAKDDAFAALAAVTSPEW